MIVVDASVLIAHLDADDACHDRAVAGLLETADHPLAASAITLAEVLVGPARTGRLHAARSALRQLEISEIPLTDGASDRLAALRAGTGLRLPDCAVLLAAQEVAADALLTLDKRLADRARELGYPDRPDPGVE